MQAAQFWVALRSICHVSICDHDVTLFVPVSWHADIITNGFG